MTILPKVNNTVVDTSGTACRVILSNENNPVFALRFVSEVNVAGKLKVSKSAIPVTPRFPSSWKEVLTVAPPSKVPVKEIVCGVANKVEYSARSTLSASKSPPEELYTSNVCPDNTCMYAVPFCGRFAVISPTSGSPEEGNVVNPSSS